MRQRRTARRGTISQPTTSRSAQTGSTAAPDSPAVPSRRHRVSLSSRLGLQTGSSSNIEMALARLRSTHSHPVVRIPRLPESLQSASRRVAAANVAANESIIDLTSSSDTEASNNSRIIPRSSSSSSSSSSSASSSSSNSALSMPIPMDTSDSDDSDNLLVETFPESPSDDEEWSTSVSTKVSQFTGASHVKILQIYHLQYCFPFSWIPFDDTCLVKSKIKFKIRFKRCNSQMRNIWSGFARCISFDKTIFSIISCVAIHDLFSVIFFEYFFFIFLSPPSL